MARLWDGLTGESIGKPLRHAALVQSVAFSPDGKRMVTGGRDGMFRIWDVRTGKPLSEPVGMPAHIQGAQIEVLYSPQGGEFATRNSALICLWNSSKGELLKTLKKKDSGFLGVGSNWAFAPDGKRLASASNAGPTPDRSFLSIWNTASGTLLFPSLPLDHSVTCVAFSPDGKLLATGGDDGVVQLFVVETGKVRQTIVQHHGRLETVVFSPDGRTLSTAGRDGSAWLWEVATGRQLGAPLHQGLVPQVDFSRTAAVLATANFEGDARVWGQANCHLPRITIPSEYRDDYFITTPLAVRQELYRFVPGGSAVITVAPPHQFVRLWAVPQGTPSSLAFPFFHALSPDGKLVLTGIPDDRRKKSNPARETSGVDLWEEESATARVADVRSGQVSGKPWKIKGQLRALAFCRDGATALSASNLINSNGQGLLARWNVQTGEQVGGPWGFTDGIGSLLPCPDGETVLIGSPTKELYWRWQLSTGQQIGRAIPSRSWKEPILFSPNGRRAAVSNFFEIHLYRLPSWEKEPAVLTHNTGVMAMKFSADSRSLVSGTMDGKCHFWDLATGKEHRPLIHPKGAIASLDISPDGKVLLTQAKDGTGRLWDIATGLPLGSWLALKGPGGAAEFRDCDKITCPFVSWR
jgi:WD40 repeat protein